jgi:hypothetical protein
VIAVPARRLLSVAKAYLSRRPLALCDVSDLDGIVCAALFKMAYREGVVVLAAPPDVRRSPLLRRVRWFFVADLPCPGKALVRADHHASNSPCAEREFYEPSAPAAAVLAARALGLEGDERARKLVKLAVETDTAKIESREALALNDAVKGSGYGGKLRLVNLLASKPLEEVLNDPFVLEAARRYEEVRRATEELAARLPAEEVFVAVFKKRLKLSFRYLCILMERKGSKMTAVLAPQGLLGLRVYLGSSSPEYDVSKIAERLGGGGHPYAAGASLACLNRRKCAERVLAEIAEHLGKERLKVLIVDEKGVEEEWWPRGF